MKNILFVHLCILGCITGLSQPQGAAYFSHCLCPHRLPSLSCFSARLSSSVRNCCVEYTLTVTMEACLPRHHVRRCIVSLCEVPLRSSDFFLLLFCFYGGGNILCLMAIVNFVSYHFSIFLAGGRADLNLWLNSGNYLGLGHVSTYFIFL